MFEVLTARLRLGHRTVKFPDAPANLPERFVGRPQLHPERCQKDDGDPCVEVCPTQALERREGRLQLDLGRCLFCQECSRACPSGALSFSGEPAMATRARADLKLEGQEFQLAQALERESLRIFGRSLRLRQVSAAGCCGCELELNALGNIDFDISRFGVGFVASPRHADGIVVTGPVSQNMRQALLDTYQAIPAPRLVIAVGACAISGGPYRDHPETCNGVEGLLPVPVDLYIPGCPPHPITLIDGLVRLLGRLR